MTIKPVNGFILLKQKEKDSKILLGSDTEKLENEFEVIDADFNIDWTVGFWAATTSRGLELKVWDTIIKWPHSGDRVNVDGEEFFIIKVENILAIKN